MNRRDFIKVAAAGFGTVLASKAATACSPSTVKRWRIFLKQIIRRLPML